MQGKCVGQDPELIVHEDIHDVLVEAIVAEVAKWPIGPGMSDGVRIGSLVHTTHREDVLKLLKAGLEHGGKVVTGGIKLKEKGHLWNPQL